MLSDSDPEKWGYQEHTRAKHRVLSRYLKAWLSILGQSGRRVLGRSQLVIVDAFAGRGRYVDGAPGSPLILRDVAGQVARDGRVDEVELFFIEPNAENYESLLAELAAAPAPPHVREHPPARAEFEQAAPRVLELLVRRPSFWSIDPFGFSGLPLALLAQILRQPRSELFITFMSRDINRFLDVDHHRTPISQTLGLAGPELDREIKSIVSSDRREVRLRDLYVRRLKEGAGAQYVWTFRVASGGAQDTVYYLVHASRHIKAFKEMKDATFELGGNRFAFLGNDDFAAHAQQELPFLETGIDALTRQLESVFAGRTLAYDQLLNEAYPDPRFHMYVEANFRAAVYVMLADGSAHKVPSGSRRPDAIRAEDALTFR